MRRGGPFYVACVEENPMQKGRTTLSMGRARWSGQTFGVLAQPAWSQGQMT
jgi:hypothetical protein